MPADHSADRPFPRLRQQLAAPITGQSQRIAPGDTMYSGREDWYRTVGQSAWRCIAASMLVADVDEPRQILDLPCGHGRVLRVLQRAFPNAELTACDIDRDGVDFCAKEFGAHPVYSRPDLGNLHFDRQFDLIWCGSLVTHLDAAGWLGTFQAFLRALRPGGLALVTFHGRWVAYLLQQGNHYGMPAERIAAMLRSYAADGFGYADYEGQPGYGISVSSPAWVLRELHAWHQLRVVSLVEKWWDDHQDVLVVQRVPDA